VQRRPDRVGIIRGNPSRPEVGFEYITLPIPAGTSHHSRQASQMEVQRPLPESDYCDATVILSITASRPSETVSNT
jgi:hypothetical protein